MPGGENTLFMPARALGAPQTTWTGSPEPVSTMQTRSRSAFGMLHGGDDMAMVKAPSAFALSSTLLDLKPDARQRLGDRVERGVGVEMLLEPGEREFHGLDPHGAQAADQASGCRAGGSRNG